jgi:hypothetical protein
VVHENTCSSIYWLHQNDCVLNSCIIENSIKTEFLKLKEVDIIGKFSMRRILWS